MKRYLLPLVVALGMMSAAPAEAASLKETNAWATPNLSAGFTPQGMTMLGNHVVMAEYKPGFNTRLVELDLNGKILGQVSIAPTHAGGIAVVGKWLYVQNADTPNHDTVRRYRVADLKLTKHPTYVKARGLQELAPWQFASFMTADDDQLLAGHHGMGEGSRMYRFDVDQKTGLLSALDYVIVPDNTQGVAPGGVFTSGGGRLTVGSTVYSIPSHAEGVVVVDKTAYVAFEGKAKYVLRYQLP